MIKPATKEHRGSRSSPALPDEDTTRLLRHWRRGDRDAGARLLERLYPDLRQLAAWHLNRLDLSLQPSDLVHEVYLKLEQQRRPDWQNRAHFFALTARLVRRVVADHLKSRSRRKRSGGQRVALASVELATPEPNVDLVDLDRAIERLEEIDTIAARVVELRYYAGLTVAETAEALELGPATVVRKWRYARARLFKELRDTGGFHAQGA